MDNYTINDYLRISDSLFSKDSSKRLEWVGVMKKVMPELVRAGYLRDNDPAQRERICTRANGNGYKLASAHMSYITPMGYPWVVFEGAGGNTDGDDKLWWGTASDAVRDALEMSNLYTELISVYIDRVFTGTACMLTENDETTGDLIHTHIPAGTYVLANNAQRMPDTCIRTFKMTPGQMVEEFGYEACSERVRQEFNSAEKRYAKEYEIRHIVMPRRDYVEMWRSVPPTMRKYMSVYIDKGNKTILREGGYYEFPYLVTRFIRYGNQVYGTSPFMGLEDVIDDLRAMDECAKITAQRSAIPPVVIPPDMVGQVDFRAGGTTVLPLQYMNAQVPRELAPPIPNATVLEEKQMLRDDLDSALFRPILEVISSVDRGMTATEVLKREEEKIMTFTQSFTQFIADAKPWLYRVFACVARSGKIDTESAPSGVFMDQKDSQDRVVSDWIVSPKVKNIGKMAQAYERAQNAGTMQAISIIQELANISQNPEMLMVVDWEETSRDLLISSGMPARLINSKDKVRQMRDELTEAQAQQAGTEQLVQQSQAGLNNAKAQQIMSQIQ